MADGSRRGYIVRDANGHLRHRMNSAATRKTSSVIAAVFGRSKITRREHLRLPRLRFALSREDVRQRLPVGVSHDVAAGHLAGAPGRREAA